MFSVVSATFLIMPSEPAEIEAALASFRSDGHGVDTGPLLPTRLDGMELEYAKHSRMDDLDVIAHRYVDPSGDAVVV